MGCQHGKKLAQPLILNTAHALAPVGELTPFDHVQGITIWIDYRCTLSYPRTAAGMGSDVTRESIRERPCHSFTLVG